MDYFLTLALTCTLLIFNQEQTRTASSSNEKIIKAYTQVTNYHAGSQKKENVVKIVYFHGNDSELQPDLDVRLTRILDDISKFYSEEFIKHGIELDGVPFEKINGKYNINIVKGDSSSKFYNIKSGQTIVSEIRQKTSGRIDLNNDYVLTINNLWYKRPDGTYVFHSPYFGMGSSLNGVCMVADCELLDPALLKDNSKKMKFSEMTVALKECPVSEFNSWYIGGIAHEMAHIFGLPHDYGNKLEIETSTISLMGQYGSRHFRDYLWGGEKSAVFSSASIIQLISHPVFTQSIKDKGRRPLFLITEVNFNNTESEIIINGNFRTDIAPYAAVALVHPVLLNEYYNQSSFDLIGNDSFSVSLGKLVPGDYRLQLAFLFPNGMAARFNKTINVDQAYLVKVKS